MSDFLAVKDWNRFQHYKYGTPVWIKLHKSLLDNMDFRLLPAAARALLIDIWLIASENWGLIPADPTLIAFRVRADVRETTEAMAHILAAGFLEVSNVKSLSAYRTKASHG